MQKHILADTSCLILLEKIGRLNWLNSLFGELIIAREVAIEYSQELPDWIAVKEIANQNLLSVLTSENLGKGEAASIALAIELNDPLLILDDLKARKKATILGLRFTGTPGILLLAKKKGICTRVKPELDNLIQQGMWLSQKLYEEIILRAGE